ncbi:MAG: hypothetical protein WC659_02440 [Patescibacteria group bacterium]
MVRIPYVFGNARFFRADDHTAGDAQAKQKSAFPSLLKKAELFKLSPLER